MVSLIMTVFNEKKTLPQWFKSYAEQSDKADELVIVDGGSSDGTWEYLVLMKNSIVGLKIIQAPGNIAHGRNVAIAAAMGDIIAVTDAGCIYGRDWLKKLTGPLRGAGIEWCATGFAPWLAPEDGILTYLIAASTIPRQDEFKKDWQPSSRSVAFKRIMWQNVGGYPEWIPYCEDVIFDRKIEKLAGRPAYVREALVFWRPRLTLRSYIQQLYNYTRSEGHGGLNINRQAIRYLAYGGAIVLLFLGMKFSVGYLAVLAGGVMLYMLKFWRRSWEFTKEKNIPYRILCLILVPLIVAIGDVGKMIGFPAGIFERITYKIYNV